MAKHQRQVSAARNKELTRIEHTDVFDDNLLPEASEIELLSAIDSGILPWLKERAAKEQDFRHEAFNSRIKLTDKHNIREHTTSRLGLGAYFILVAGCLFASFFLVRDNHNTEGSIFGGAGAILALAVILTRKNTEPPKQ